MEIVIGNLDEKLKGKMGRFFQFSIDFGRSIDVLNIELLLDVMVLSYKDDVKTIDLKKRRVFLSGYGYDCILNIEDNHSDIFENISCLLDEDYEIDCIGVKFRNLITNEIYDFKYESLEHQSIMHKEKIRFRGETKIGFILDTNMDVDLFVINKYMRDVDVIFYNKRNSNGFELTSDFDDIPYVVMDGVSFDSNNIDSNSFKLIISPYRQFDFSKLNDIKIALVNEETSNIYVIPKSIFTGLDINAETKTIEIGEVKVFNGVCELDLKMSGNKKKIESILSEEGLR